MDAEEFLRIERITGSVTPVDSNPTEPARPGVLHYLATMHRDGRSFANHLSAPVGEPVDLPDALRMAATRARRVEDCEGDRERWLRASGIADEPSDPLRVGAAHAEEVDLWLRAQRAEAQALRTFMGEVGYRTLMDLVGPTPALPDAASAESALAAASAPVTRGSPGRWWVGAAVGLAAIAVPMWLARSRRRRSPPLRRMLAV